MASPKIPPDWGYLWGIGRIPKKRYSQLPLSDVKIRNLKSRDKSYKVTDFDGLFIAVKPTASRLWHFKYRIDGKEKLLSLGIYPAVSFAQARAGRVEARPLLANGQDPGEARKDRKLKDQEKRGITFAAQASLFAAKAKREGRAASTIIKTTGFWTLLSRIFGKRPISEVTAPMVLRCLHKVEAKGNYETAKRLRAKIGGVFRYAVANGHAETDPTYALRDALIRPTVTSCAAITDPVALGGLMRAINVFHGQTTTKIELQLLAILAQRLGELRNAYWQEFDLEAEIWSIPAERIKMRRPHKVPIPPQALALMRELQLLTGSGSYVFPSLVSTTRHISENILNTILGRMGISAEEMTSHGFRATFSTLARDHAKHNPAGQWTTARSTSAKS